MRRRYIGKYPAKLHSSRAEHADMDNKRTEATKPQLWTQLLARRISSQNLNTPILLLYSEASKIR